ncbi:hypothetical protein ElyMa_000046800 [Elysia marginata]|uniref:Uncharacterized protein n=1 Tax=Elysia marginata TaxID=1093978 RepID=A0AAV4EFF3_9GAST|nr:hypothetical protein ElyMa_000046800 [Elysia marginata]
MENPEAIFDVLSIRSMKERYYASNGTKSSVPATTTKTSLFTPTPSAAIVSDLAFLANQEALEHFVQDFTIDDSISDCFADSEPIRNFGFSSKAPSRIEQELLTPPNSSKPDVQLGKTKGQSINQFSKASTSRPKVTFALRTTSVVDNFNLDGEVQKSPSSQENQQNFKGTNRSFLNISPSQHGNTIVMADGEPAHAHSSQNSILSSEKINVLPCEEMTEQLTLKQGHKPGDRGKLAQREKDKDTHVSKFPRFGLSWVIDNTIHRGKKQQSPNKVASRIGENKTAKHLQDKTSLPVKDSKTSDTFTITPNPSGTAKDYTITSIGVTKSNDKGLDDILVTPRNGTSAVARANKNTTDNSQLSADCFHKPSVSSCSERSTSTVTSFNGDSQRQNQPSKPDLNSSTTSFESTNHHVYTDDSKGIRKASSYQGKLLESKSPSHVKFNTHIPGLGGTKPDQVTAKPWYEGSTFADNETDSKPSVQYSTKNRIRAPLCDVINNFNDSEKDSEVSFVEKSGQNESSDKKSECSSQDLTQTLSSKGFTKSFDSTLLQHKDGFGRTKEADSKDRNDCENPKTTKPITASNLRNLHTESLHNTIGGISLQCDCLLGEESLSKVKNPGLLKETDESSNLNVVLNLICEELVRRSMLVENNRERCVSCLNRSIPDACASLTVASNQLIKLVTLLEEIGSLPTDVISQLKQTTEDIMSTTEYLKTTVNSLEMDVNVSGNDSSTFPGIDGIVENLTESAWGMLRDGCNLCEVKSKLGQLVSDTARVANRSIPDKSRNTDYADVKMPIDSSPSTFTHGTNINAKTSVLDARSILSPEESYPLSIEQFQDNKNTFPKKYQEFASGTFNEQPGAIGGMTQSKMDNDRSQGQSSAIPYRSKPIISQDLLTASKSSPVQADSSPERTNSFRFNESHIAGSLCHATTGKNQRFSRSDRKKRRRSHSLGRLQHVHESSDILEDSSSAAEDDDETPAAAKSVSQNETRLGVRGRHHRRRSHSAIRHRSRSRRKSSCHSCHSEASSKFSKLGSCSGNSQEFDQDCSDDDASERKNRVHFGGSLRDIATGGCIRNKKNNARQKDFGLSRSELSRFRKGRKQSHGVGDFDYIDHAEDVEEDDDDDEGDSLKVCVNVPNEDFSDNALRVQRLKQHLNSMQKLRQKSRYVIETVVTGTGERLAPRPLSRDRSHDNAHVNIGEAYPFRSQEERSHHEPHNGSTSWQCKDKTQTGKPQQVKEEKPKGPFKGKRGMTSHLFNHERLETPKVQVRELTESE